MSTVVIGLRVIETLKPLHHVKVAVSTEGKNCDCYTSGIHYPRQHRVSINILDPSGIPYPREHKVGIKTRTLQVYTTHESTRLV